MDSVIANNYLQSTLPIFTIAIEGMQTIHIFYDGHVDGLMDKAYGVSNKIPAVLQSMISQIEKHDKAK